MQCLLSRVEWAVLRLKQTSSALLSTHKIPSTSSAKSELVICCACHVLLVDCYVCDSCEFLLDVRCAVQLPAPQTGQAAPAAADVRRHSQPSGRFLLRWTWKRNESKKVGGITAATAIYPAIPGALKLHPVTIETSNWGRNMWSTYELLTTKRRCYLCYGFHCASCKRWRNDQKWRHSHRRLRNISDSYQWWCLPHSSCVPKFVCICYF